MTFSFQLSKLRSKIPGASDVSDFEILQPSSLLICLSRYLGKLAVINLKTLRTLRVLNLHKPTVVSHHFNKLLVHSSGVVCCLQASRIFQSNVFICSLRRNFNFSIPFEASNSTRSIALLGDMLITSGVSSKIRFWDIATGEFVDDICFQRNSVCISNLIPCEEKLMLVCVEETTNSMWLVSLQSKKIVRSIPLYTDQTVILAPLRNKFASFVPNQKIVNFWTIDEQYGHADFRSLQKTQVNSFDSFLLVADEDKEHADQVIYTTPTGLKCKQIATNQVVSEFAVDWQSKRNKKLPIKALSQKNEKKMNKKLVFLHDGLNILVIA